MAQSLADEKLLTLAQMVQILNIPKHRLVYLFDSRKLKVEDFLTMPNGHRVFRESDISKIKAALFEISQKG